MIWVTAWAQSMLKPVAFVREVKVWAPDEGPEETRTVTTATLTYEASSVVASAEMDTSSDPYASVRSFTHRASSACACGLQRYGPTMQPFLDEGWCAISTRRLADARRNPVAMEADVSVVSDSCALPWHGRPACHRR